LINTILSAWAFKGQCSVWAKARQVLFPLPRLKSRGNGIGKSIFQLLPDLSGGRI